MLLYQLYKFEVVLTGTECGCNKTLTETTVIGTYTKTFPPNNLGFRRCKKLTEITGYLANGSQFCSGVARAELSLGRILFKLE